MKPRPTSAARLILLSVALIALTACNKTGLNAGRQGGMAFVGMAVMLVLTAAILWYFLGREE